MTVKVSHGAQVAAERELCRRSLYHFVRLAWHIVEPTDPFQENWHILAICKALERVARGETRQIIITIPPGCGKSLLVCVMFDAWVWTFWPGCKFLYTSFDANLTRRDGGKTLQIIQSEWYQQRWGGVFTLPKDAAHSDFKNDQGGFRFASSVDGKTTGNHPHIICVDDSIKPAAVNEKSLQHVIDWWKNTMLSRGVDPSTVRRVLIQQRLAENDLPGYFLTEEAGNWEHLNVPLLYDARFPQPYDPRTKTNECFWPARFPPEVVARLQKDLGSRVFSAQYQQRPAPDTGLIFRKEWFGKRWTELPTKFDDACQSWDMTFKGSDGSDYVVGQVWYRIGGEYYLVDQVRGRWSFVETAQAVRDLSAKWPKVCKKLIENKANGPAVESTLGKEISGIVLVEPQGGKVARANASTPLWEAGNVWIPELAPWVSDFAHEHCAFPTAAHDDQVDTSSQALTHLAEKKSNLAAAMAGALSMEGVLWGQ